MATEFSRAPRESDPKFALEILRVPAKGLSGLVCTSKEPLGAWTHFAHTRTLPCEGEECEWCADGLPRRWYGWLGVQGLRTQRHVLLTYTDSASPLVNAAYEQYGSLRGLVIDAYRIGDRPNGRLRLIFRACGKIDWELAAEPNRQAILEHLWEAPKQQALAARLREMMEAATEQNREKKRK